jgi:tetratricopeptide (TPR) repeat protein
MTAPNEDASLLQQAIALHNAGDLAKAEGLYRQILSRDVNNADASYLLGVIAGQTEHYDAAIGLICRAIAARPQVPLYYQGLAETYRQMKKFAEATVSIEQALALEPESAIVLERLAEIQKEAERFEDAVVTLNRLLKVAPNSFDTYNNLGTCLVELRRMPDALDMFQKALQINADFAEAHNNLGACLLQMSRPAEAMEEFLAALRLKPDNSEARTNIGAALLDQNRVAEAIASFRQTIALDPNFANAHYDLALALLMDGQLAEGWEEHEWRWRSRQFREPRHTFNRPQWDGSDLRGKALFVHAEQGFGDTIQFIRYVPLLAERGANVILLVPRELCELAKSVGGDATLVADGMVPPHDFHCSLMTVPRFFTPDIASIPAEIPYLRPDAAKVARWKSLVAPREQGLRVGVVWAGRPDHMNEHNRSMPLDRLRPLAAVSGAMFYSLQKRGVGAPPLNPPPGLNLIDLTEHLTDFSETASMIANLDLVISVDTAVAHLAGAIGKPVWVLLPFAPDWRWLLGREDSPWYPTARLFRQTKPRDWETIVAKLVDALVSFSRDPKGSARSQPS